MYSDYYFLEDNLRPVQPGPTTKSALQFHGRAAVQVGSIASGSSSGSSGGSSSCGDGSSSGSSSSTYLESLCKHLCLKIPMHLCRSGPFTAA